MKRTSIELAKREQILPGPPLIYIQMKIMTQKVFMLKNRLNALVQPLILKGVCAFFFISVFHLFLFLGLWPGTRLNFDLHSTRKLESQVTL